MNCKVPCTEVASLTRSFTKVEVLRPVPRAYTDTGGLCPPWTRGKGSPRGSRAVLGRLSISRRSQCGQAPPRESWKGIQVDPTTVSPGEGVGGAARRTLRLQGPFTTSRILRSRRNPPGAEEQRTGQKAGVCALTGPAPFPSRQEGEAWGAGRGEVGGTI